MKNTNFFSEQNMLMLLICLVGIVLVIPFFSLSMYNVPGASDDFFHGFYREDENYLSGVWNWYVEGYNTRYSNAIFMQWPGRPFLNLRFGIVFPMVSFVFLFFSVFKFVQSFLPSRKTLEHLAFTVSVFSFLLCYIPVAKQLYWFSGYTVYTMPAIFYFFLMSILLRKFNDKLSKIEMTLVSTLLFLIIGAHENWMVTGTFSIYFLAVNVLFRKEKLTIQSIYLVVLSTVFLGLVILGPGVTNRMANEGASSHNGVFFDSFYYSFIHLGNYFYEWFIGSGFVLIAFLMMLRSKPNTVKGLSSPVELPVNLLFFMFILYTGFFVLIYSLGSTLTMRMRGIVPNFFVGTAVLLQVVYIMGSSRIVNVISEKISERGIYISLLLCVLFSVSNSPNFTSVCEDLSTGKAERQAENAKYIFSLIEASDDSEVSVPQQDVVCEALYAIKFPTKRKGLDYWIKREHFNKNVIVNPNISINSHRKKYNVVNGKIQRLIYKEFPYGEDQNFTAKEVSNKTVYLTSEIMNDKIPERAFFIIFQGKSFFKSVNIKDHIKNKEFKYKFDFPEMDGEKAKIYFTNTTSDTLVVQNFNCEILP